MIVDPSPQLKESIVDILNNKHPGLFTFDCTFFNPDNPKIQVKPFLMTRFNVNQRFNVTYMDEITMEIQVTPQMYIDLIQNYQNLRCSLILEYVDRETSQPIEQYPPRKLQYLAIIVNMSDLLKKYNINELIPESEDSKLEAHQARMITMQFQFFEETAYNLRHIQINALLHKAKLVDVLHYISNLFQIKHTKIIPPDNTKIYQTLPLPPMLGIVTDETQMGVFEFLQERYGVYSKGMGYYYTNETLFVYPAYETNPKQSTSDAIVHIYNAPANHYVGSDSYHCYKGKDIHLVANDQVQVKDFTDQGMENYGTSVVALRADTTVDLSSSTTANGSTLGKKNTLACGLNTTRGITSKSSNNTRYTSSTNNLFYEASAMASYHCVMVSLPWANAELLSLVPGQRVVFHYDEQGRYKTQVGILETVVYNVSLEKRQGQQIFSTTAILALRLAPEKFDG